MSPPATVDGYVADSLYPSNFHPHFQPAWTQAMLEARGVAPPTRDRAPFTFVDLGCGDGVGLIVTAASHPEGRFFGIDALPGHIARGNALIAELGLTNIELHCATFQEAVAGQGDLARLPLGSADYAMSQGVLSWVSPQNQHALLTLASRLLRPGGVFSVGYNTLPGWGWLVPFQRLVRALSETLPGTPAERFEAARDVARSSGLIDPKVFEWFDERLHLLPRDYFAHEYLNAHWHPHWSADVVRAAGEFGLAHAADGLTLCLREDFALKATWRKVLETITDPLARMLAIDIWVERWFRVDLFAKGPVQQLDPAAARADRLAQHWATGTTAYDVSFELRTPAGTIRFANDAARAILNALQDGPLPLAAVPGIGEADLLNTIDALWMADFVRPVLPPLDPPRGAQANAWLFATASDDAPMNGVVSRHGGVAVPRTALAAGLSADSCRRLAIVAPAAAR